MQDPLIDEAFATWGPPVPVALQNNHFTRALLDVSAFLFGVPARMDDYTCAGMLAIEQALEIRATDGWATWSYYHGIGEW